MDMPPTTDTPSSNRASIQGSAKLERWTKASCSGERGTEESLGHGTAVPLRSWFPSQRKCGVPVSRIFVAQARMYSVWGASSWKKSAKSAKSPATATASYLGACLSSHSYQSDRQCRSAVRSSFIVILERRAFFHFWPKSNPRDLRSMRWETLGALGVISGRKRLPQAGLGTLGIEWRKLWLDFG